MNIHSVSKFLEQNNYPKYRLEQLKTGFYKEFIASFFELKTWPKDLKEKVARFFSFSAITPVKVLTSKDQNTIKVLFSRKEMNNQCFESVLMRYQNGLNTVCVSSMVGCPVGCRFCATGQLGFVANLSAEEIADQVLYFARILKKENKKVSNIVFMGMGEPLLNLAAVKQAISIFTDFDKLGFSDRRITISTCGITPKLKELFSTGYKGKIALSLHATNQKLREKIMPIAKRYPLKELLTVLNEFAVQNNKRITYEYVLLSGINDQEEQAIELAEILDHRLSLVNLIPYNPVPKVEYSRPSNNAVHKFSRLLTAKGLKNTIRVTMGEKITAACGQLACISQKVQPLGG